MQSYQNFTISYRGEAAHLPMTFDACRGMEDRTHDLKIRGEAMAKIAEPSAGMSLRLILTLESASDMMTNFSAIMPLRLLGIRRRISRGHGLELVFENMKHV